MSITRTSYITVAELNEILGVSTYTIETIGTKIYEASEILKSFMFDSTDDNGNEYDTSTAPTNLKLATAYQVKYMEENDDDSYDSSSNGFSLGKFSQNSSNNTPYNGEYRKISPKSRRYLVDGGLIRRYL
jgi:transcriptional antiterminator